MFLSKIVLSEQNFEIAIARYKIIAGKMKLKAK